MKKKTPPFDYLIEELVKSIELRHNKKLPEEQIEVMKTAWKHKQEDLWKMIKTLKQNEGKANAFLDTFEEREVEFQLGVSISGEPIIVKHVIEQKNNFINSKRYTKSQKIKSKTFMRVRSFISKTIF